MTAATATTSAPALPRVAVVGPLTGPRAAWGRLLEDGVAGLVHAPVAWELVDDRGNARHSEARAREIAADGGFAAVAGHFSSQGAWAALPVYHRAGLAAVLPLATAPGLLDGIGPTALRLCPDDEDQAREIVRVCVARGHRRLVVTNDGSKYGLNLARRVLAAARAEPSVTARCTAWPPQTGAAAVVCGVHHAVARLIGAGRPHGPLVVVTDDCDVPEFGELLVGGSTEVLVTRLVGGPRPRVAAALTALAAALEKHPERRGSALLAAVRAEVPDGLLAAGWETAPVRATARAGGTVDVAVVGGGLVGRAVADELAERGARVMLIDHGGSMTAASAVSGGLVRAFELDEAHRRLAVRSFELLWGRPGVAEAHGMRRTGSLVLLGEEHFDAGAAGVAQLHAAGLPAELLPAGELARRWPALDVRGLFGAVWEPEAGYAVPAVAMAAVLDRAQRAGVRLVRHRVRRVTSAGLELSGGGTIAAGATVVAAGCAARELLGHRWPAGHPAHTRRIRYAVLDAARAGSLPALVDLTTGMWGRPDGGDGFLAGRPVDEWDVPVRAGAGLTEPQVDWIRRGLRERLPALAGARVLVGRFGTDLYTPTGPVVGTLPGAPGVVLAAAWSGGGFKTAPAAGELAADAACAALDDVSREPTDGHGGSHADPHH